MPTQLWIAIHHHRHGEDVYPFFDTEPAEDDVISAIEASSSYEPEREEWIEVRGPFDVPSKPKMPPDPPQPFTEQTFVEFITGWLELNDKAMRGGGP